MKRALVFVSLIAACASASNKPRPSEEPIVIAKLDAGPQRPSKRDGDGVVDDRDRCPDQPEDCDGFEDADGCPDLDNDKDSIPDTCDVCPNQPETFNSFSDEDGCPDDHQSMHAWMTDPRTELNLPLGTFHFQRGSSAPARS